MRTVLSYPGNMAHAQNAALALYEARSLDCFVTSLNWRPESLLGRSLASVGGRLAGRALKQAARKSVTRVSPDLVHTYMLGESLRLLTSKISNDPVATDKVWDWSSHRFDRFVARKYVPNTEVIQAFEYAALQSFERAADRGVARVLHLPSLDSLQFEKIQRREKCNWPELRSPHDSYFDAKFERRYARRLAEIRLADLVIANSSLTARSHIAAGADPAKIRVVPLAAPLPIARIKDAPERMRRPLIAIWAGNFGLGKGAHYMLEAWRLLAPGNAARLDVYGKVAVPERLLRQAPDNVVFHGATPQPDLFEAYQAADILVFPTLSDGFGMVVAEAFAHGLPVLTTDQAGSSDLVNADNGLVVPAADPGALAEALRWCLNNRDRLAEMRHHALATARVRQWPHFRRDLILALMAGLLRRGYRPLYKIPEVLPI